MTPDTKHSQILVIGQLLYLYWNNLCIIQLWHGIFSFHPFGQTLHFQNYFHSFLRYSGGTGLDATCAGSGVAVSGWGTINHWGGGSLISIPICTLSRPPVFCLVPPPGMATLWNPAVFPFGNLHQVPVAPHLRPSFFSQLNKCWVLPCRSGKC